METDSLSIPFTEHTQNTTIVLLCSFKQKEIIFDDSYVDELN